MQAAIVVLVVTLALLPLREELGVLNVMLLLLMVSLGLGLTLGGGPAAIGAILAFFAFDYAFLPPYHTLTVSDPDHVLVLFVYLGVAIISATLVGRIRTRTMEAERESQRTTTLYDLNRALVSDATLDRLLSTITESVVSVYGSRSCRLISYEADETLRVLAVTPGTEPFTIDRQAAAVAQWVVQHALPAGLGTQRGTILQPHGSALHGAMQPKRIRESVLFVPIVTPSGVRGVLEVSGRPGGGRFSVEDERLLGNFANQAALALERTRMIDEITRVQVLEQSNELKSALLAAVSHDLRTPLTAIKASASAMLDHSVVWSDNARDELLATIDEETDRLTLMVSNLLDLSRIEGGVLQPDRDWHAPDDLILDAVEYARRQFSDHEFIVEFPEDPPLPLMFLDWTQISQVLINVLGNAAKYSAPGTTVTVSGRLDGDMIEIRVQDMGIGIRKDYLEAIFERFFRVNAFGTVRGSGIGLAICKGLVEAHGGSIRAESVPGSGTTMIVRLPIDGENDE